MNPGLSITFILITASAVCSCAPNEGVLHSGRANSPSAPNAAAEVSPFERDLAEAKGADFTWLYVVRRRDGGILTDEDKAFIRKHTAEANRRILTDGGKAVIIGSNYSATVDGAKALRELLDVADHSPPSPNR